MGPGIFTFSRACYNFVSKRFETTETFGLSQFLSCFSPFQFFPYINHCFSVSKHQKWGLVFSPFPEHVSKRFETTETFGLSQFLSCFSPFQFFPYIIHCFSVSKTRNGAWYFHFFRACFNFVSKHLETTETFRLSQFLSCFSPFQFFPNIIHCFSVSKHQKWGLVFSLFPELVSILFRNVSKQLKHMDLVNFLPVSVRFSFFPI